MEKDVGDMTLGLDIGCADNKHTEIADKVIGLDIRPFEGVDVVYDIEKLPLKFETEKFDAVMMDNVLEHVSPDKFVQLMDEIWRIMKFGATLTIIVPHHTNPTSLEPEHRMRFSSDSLSCLDRKYANSPSFIKNKFRLIKRHMQLIFPFGWLSGFASKFNYFYDYRLCHFLPARDITFVFEKCEI